MTIWNPALVWYNVTTKEVRFMKSKNNLYVVIVLASMLLAFYLESIEQYVLSVLSVLVMGFFLFKIDFDEK